MDLGNIWGQITDAANQGLSDLSKTAVPALEAALEQQAINILQTQKQAATQNLNAGIKEIQSRPVVPGSFGDTFSGLIGDSFTAANAPMILGAVAGVLAIGWFIFRK